MKTVKTHSLMTKNTLKHNNRLIINKYNSNRKNSDGLMPIIPNKPRLIKIASEAAN